MERTSLTLKKTLASCRCDFEKLHDANQSIM